MRLLLDTHYCIWLTLRRDRLSSNEFRILIDPNNDLAFSSVSICELRIKWDLRHVSGERKGEASPIDVLDGLRTIDLASIDLTPALAAGELGTPITYRDPFDTLLLTIAQENGRKLFTRDKALRGHPLAFHAD